MFDVFSIISKGFSGLTGGSSKSAVIGQTVPNTPGQIGKAGGDMNAYAATDSPSIEIKSGLGSHGQNLSSGGAAPTHYGDVIGDKTANGKEWLKQAQAAFDKAQQQGGNEEIQSSPLGQASPVHYQNLGQMGGGEAAAKAPILGVNALLGQKQKITSTDFKNSQFGG